MSSSDVSKMLFNLRVLSHGTDDINPDDLKKQFYFTEIFKSNSDEIFKSSDTMDHDVLKLYINGHRAYVNNLNAICSKLAINNDTSFESRLALEKLIHNQLRATYHVIGDTSVSLMKFIANQLYYVSMVNSHHLIISTTDMNQSIYNSSCEDVGFVKIDYSIVDYLNRTFGPTVAITVSSSNVNSLPTKVEYYGSQRAFNMFLGELPGTPLVIHNKYIYTDDIKKLLIDKNSDTATCEVPDYSEFTLDQLFENDQLIEYPIDSFDSYLKFLHSVSVHPDATSIQLCLYRIGDNPGIYYLLKDAVSRGIAVTVNIEECASNEHINVFWSNEMRAIGIDVINYAHGDLKVHCKLTLATFDDGRQIAQIGTGNYHHRTTQLYTDLSYFTTDPIICQGSMELFALIKGNKEKHQINLNRNFLVAPFNARDILIKLINREANKGDKGYVAIKCNNLNDHLISEALNRAANKGCTIELIVRSICTWRSNLPNVRIRSIIWDNLEHSRVFQFGSGNDKRIYTGSLDPVDYKLDKRLELLVRVTTPYIVDKLEQYLQRYIADNSNAWIMITDGNEKINYMKME